MSHVTLEKIELNMDKILLVFKYNDTKYYRALNSMLAKLRNNFIQINRPSPINYDKILFRQFREIINIEKTFLNTNHFNKKWNKIEIGLNSLT